MTEILTAADVAAHFRISISNLKRWVLQTRRGLYDFPMPISPKRSKLRWRKSDIENWNSQIGNVPAQRTPQREKQRHD